MMNSRKQGDIGVAAAILYYTKEGHTVSLPTTEASRYDLIVDKNNTLYKVQCKTSTVRSVNDQNYVVNLATHGGNRSWENLPKKLTSDEIDLVFIWCENDSIWEIPVSEIERYSSVNIGNLRRNYQVGGPEEPIIDKKPTTRKQTIKHRIKRGNCLDCQTPVDSRSKRCVACDSRRRNGVDRVEWPEDQKLVKIYIDNNKNMLATSKVIGVSNTALKKRLSHPKFQAMLKNQ